VVGIKYPTFVNWVQQRRRKRGDYVAGKVPSTARDKVRWLEAVVEPAQNPGGQSQPALVLALPGGARLEITSMLEDIWEKSPIESCQESGKLPDNS
jgi:hypothetical protein